MEAVPQPYLTSDKDISIFAVVELAVASFRSKACVSSSASFLIDNP